MNIKDQCCLIEQGRELNELGVKSSSLFIHLHYRFPVDKKDTVQLVPLAEAVNALGAHGRVAVFMHLLPAFTSAELGELLPVEARSRKSIDSAGNPMWHCGCGIYDCEAATEALARADLLIALLRNKQLKAEELPTKLHCESNG